MTELIQETYDLVHYGDSVARDRLHYDGGSSQRECASVLEALHIASISSSIIICTIAEAALRPGAQGSWQFNVDASEKNPERTGPFPKQFSFRGS